MSLNSTPFSNWVQSPQTKHFPQTSPFNSSFPPTNPPSSNPSSAHIGKGTQNSMNSLDTASQTPITHYNPSSYVIYPIPITSSNTIKPEFGGNNDDSFDFPNEIQQPNYLLRKLRSHGDLEIPKEPLASVAPKKGLTMVPRSATFAVLQPIIERNETPRDGSSDVTEISSPESNFPDIRKMDQTLLQ